MSKLLTGATEAHNFLNTNFSTFEADEIEFVLPTTDNLTAGRYKSKIDHFDVIEEDGKVTAIDCFHNLEDNDGNVVHVRFRIFEGKGGIKDIMNVFKSYRFNSFNEAVGVEETVMISPKKGSDYLFIIDRKKANQISSLTRSLNKAKVKTPPPEIDAEDDEDEDYDFLEDID